MIAQRRAEPDYDARLVGRLLRRARLGPDAQLRRLSAGQRTRLLLAVALGIRPTLLMLDEPLAHLDPLARTEVLDQLREHLAGGDDRTILRPPTTSARWTASWTTSCSCTRGGWCSRAVRSTCSRTT